MTGMMILRARWRFSLSKLVVMVCLLGGCGCSCEVLQKRAMRGHLQALRSDDANARYDAARTLKRVGDVSAIPALLEVLAGDPVPEVREEAAKAIGGIGSRQTDGAGRVMEGYRVLIARAREDEVLHVRRAAVRALSRMPASASSEVKELVINGLLGLMHIRGAADDPSAFHDTVIHCAASDTLGEMGMPAVPGLRSLLTDDDWRVRWTVLRQLQAINPPGLREDAARLLDDPHSIVQNAAQRIVDAVP